MTYCQKCDMFFLTLLCWWALYKYWSGSPSKDSQWLVHHVSTDNQPELQTLVFFQILSVTFCLKATVQIYTNFI